MYNMPTKVESDPFFYETKKIIEITGTGSVNYTEFTSERKALEPGDYYADITKIKNAIGWEPKIKLDDGIKRTIEYYKKNKSKYWQ